MSKGGGTSNLRKHINSKHPSISLKCAEKTARMGKYQNFLNHFMLCCLPPSHLPAPPTTTSEDILEGGITIISQEKVGVASVAHQKKRQTTIAEFNKRPTSLARQKRLNNSLIEMIVGDLQPFSIVEDTGFRNFTAALDPTYQMPSRTTLSRSLLPQIFETCVEKVQKLLNSSEHITLTTDTWTSVATEGYMAVTAHFLIEWEMKSCLLNCFKISGRHTAENLRNLLLQESKR